MMNKDKVILDLCGGTGAWSKPYRDAGYKVYVLTLPDCDITKMGSDGTEIHFGKKHFPMKNIYGILAAPPCTEFSIAKGAAQRDFAGAMKVVHGCMHVIWVCRTHGNLKFWAMENPVGFLRQFMGKPAYTFEQWQFGANTVKATDIWGYFNEPRSLVKVRPEGIIIRIGHRSNGRDWAKPVTPEEYRHLDLDRAAARAITPAGFAQAFFRANK
jgi:hypothetical protein